MLPQSGDPRQELERVRDYLSSFAAFTWVSLRSSMSSWMR